MTTSTVVYLGNLRTELTHTKSKEIITTDAPPDNNGKGEYFSPTDLCATSLASCMITIMGIKANNMGIELGRIEADVYKVMASNPRRISAIKIELRMAGKYEINDKISLEVAGLNCPVAKSLHPDIDQDIRFVWQD
jgi:putative redox protein